MSKGSILAAISAAGILAACAVSPPPAATNPRYDAEANQPPAYPARSRRLGEEGRVIVRALVSETGQPAQVSLRQSSGYPELDKSALGAVRTWRFIPATRDGAAVQAWVDVPITFRLED